MTTASVRVSRNTSKSSTHKPVQVSSDPSTPLESPRIKRKNLLIHKPISKASSRSDRSEKMKLVPPGKITACKDSLSMNIATLSHLLYI